VSGVERDLAIALNAQCVWTSGFLTVDWLLKIYLYIKSHNVSRIGVPINKTGHESLLTPDVSLVGMYFSATYEAT